MRNAEYGTEEYAYHSKLSNYQFCTSHRRQIIKSKVKVDDSEDMGNAHLSTEISAGYLYSCLVTAPRCIVTGLFVCSTRLHHIYTFNVYHARDMTIMEPCRATNEGVLLDTTTLVGE